jgi:glycosyltransferase involved in cell wall biosynthesis
MTTEPDVDVVIPTLNAGVHLEECLSSIRCQSYEGRIRIMVIDGGSTDDTLLVSNQHSADVFVRPGMYATGLHGARNYGLSLCKAEYYWQIDSDNILLEQTTLRELVRPFIQDPALTISFPEISPQEHGSSLSTWFALEEQRKVTEMKSRGTAMGNWTLFPDLEFGLCNGSLIKTEALRQVGGYDSDVRTLQRLRRAGRSRAALVNTSHYAHYTVESPRDFVRKLKSRTRRFGKMTGTELRAYFADYEADRSSLKTNSATSVFGAPARAVVELLRGGRREWAWGLVYPLIVGYALAQVPTQTLATFFNFL